MTGKQEQGNLFNGIYFDFFVAALQAASYFCRKWARVTYLLFTVYKKLHQKLCEYRKEECRVLIYSIVSCMSVSKSYRKLERLLC